MLYPLNLRDVLVWSAAAEFYRVLWSDRILDEATRNLVRDGRIVQAGAERLVGFLRLHFPEACVTDYDGLISAMPNAEHDRHVTAAAVRGGAQVIVTFNLKDFAKLPDGIVALHPDDFLLDLLDLFGQDMLDELRVELSAHKKPPQTLEQLLAALAKPAPKFVAEALSGLETGRWS